jgi:hypothetical protein
MSKRYDVTHKMFHSGFGMFICFARWIVRALNQSDDHPSRKATHRETVTLWSDTRRLYQRRVRLSTEFRNSLEPGRIAYVVNASESSVFCSTSWALAEPVAGLALAERFTVSTGRSPAILRKRGRT